MHFLKCFLDPRKAAAVAVVLLPARSQALTWAEAPQLLEWVPSRSTVGCPETGHAVAKKPRGPGSPIGNLCFSSVYTCGTVEGPWRLPGYMTLLWAAAWSLVTTPSTPWSCRRGSGQAPPGLIHRSPPDCCSFCSLPEPWECFSSLLCIV